MGLAAVQQLEQSGCSHEKEVQKAAHGILSHTQACTARSSMGQQILHQSLNAMYRARDVQALSPALSTLIRRAYDLDSGIKGLGWLAL